MVLLCSFIDGKSIAVINSVLILDPCTLINARDLIKNCWLKKVSMEVVAKPETVCFGCNQSQI